MEKYTVIFEGGREHSFKANSLPKVIVKAVNWANEFYLGSKILSITDEMERTYTDIILTVHYKLQV